MLFDKLLRIPTEKIQSLFSSANSITAGKQLSKGEEKELMIEVKKFNRALNKVSKGRIVTPELAPTVKAFESAGYDLSKLPGEMGAGLRGTYNDLQNFVRNDPNKYKNTSAELYCNLYEMFADNSMARAVSRFKSSKFIKENEKSREMLNGVASFEQYLADQSSEGIFAATTTALNTIGGTVVGVNNLLGILTVLIVFLIAAIVVLCIINIAYTTALQENVKLLTEDAVKNKGKLKSKNEIVQMAMDKMESDIPPISRILFFKPVNTVSGFVKNFFVKNYNKFDRDLTEIDKLKGSKEDLEQSEEFLGLGAVASGIFIALCLPVLLACSRQMIYYVGHCRLKMSEFFKEQAEWVDINIESLIEKRDDPTTPASEKERLNKIIEKQKTWSDRLIKYSQNCYKTQVEAGNDTRTNIRDDDNKESEIERETEDEVNVNKTNNETNVDESTSDTSVNTPNNKPIAVF